MRSSSKYPLWLGLQFIGLPVLLFLVFGGSLIPLSYTVQQLVGIATVVALALVVSGLVLARRLQRAQQRMIAKQEEFIAHASHELKTPIAAQRTLLEVSRNDVPPASTKEWHGFIDRVLAQNSRLERLSEQLIRLNLDQADDACEVVNVQEIIERVANNMQVLAGSKHITIDVSTAPQRAKVRPTDLYDILVIVLDNAIKFSPEHSAVTVTSGTQNGHVMIAIQDQGVGMNRQDMKRAFEPFYRAKAIKTTGSGLGLAIAKKIAERNGGAITLENAPVSGMTVTITLDAYQ
jgi:signal transduction histidine kinase